MTKRELMMLLNKVDDDVEIILESCTLEDIKIIDVRDDNPKKCYLGLDCDIRLINVLIKQKDVKDLFPKRILSDEEYNNGIKLDK